jgi:TrpR family trp operon transcriptional repressor
MTQCKKGLSEFISLCNHIEDAKMLNAVFTLFLTAEEREDLAMRYLIVKELMKQNKSQREIAKDLNVSIAKITRGSNELKRMDKVLLEYLKARL